MGAQILLLLGLAEARSNSEGNKWTVASFIEVRLFEVYVCRLPTPALYPFTFRYFVPDFNVSFDSDCMRVTPHDV